MRRFMLRYIKLVLMLTWTQVVTQLTERYFYLALWHSFFLIIYSNYLGGEKGSLRYVERIAVSQFARTPKSLLGISCATAWVLCLNT